jgi:hypothetical protein
MLCAAMLLIVWNTPEARPTFMESGREARFHRLAALPLRQLVAVFSFPISSRLRDA